MTACIFHYIRPRPHDKTSKGISRYPEVFLEWVLRTGNPEKIGPASQDAAPSQEGSHCDIHIGRLVGVFRKLSRNAKLVRSANTPRIAGGSPVRSHITAVIRHGGVRKLIRFTPAALRAPEPDNVALCASPDVTIPSHHPASN